MSTSSCNRNCGACAEKVCPVKPEPPKETVRRNIINLLVENQPGVLARIVGLISGRGYNIDTLNVGPTHDPKVSKMTVVVPGDARVIEQVIAQLGKQINVLGVTNVTSRPHLHRELILVEVAASAENRAQLMEIATLFKAHIVGVRTESVTIQMIGDENTVADFMQLLVPYKVLDMSRSGVIAVVRDGSGTV